MALFFNQRKPRGFNYQPRYYDPDREAREERKRIVLGEKYRSPEELAREAAGESADTQEYVPGSFLRRHIAARRGASAAEAMQKRRKRTASLPILIGILVVIAFIAWMLYFK